MTLVNLFKNIKQFVFKHYLLIILIVVPIDAISAFTALVAYNQTTHFCYNCHSNKGPYKYFDKDIPAHKNVDNSSFSCIKCHKDKTVQTIYFRGMKRTKKFSENVANLKFQNRINPRATYTTEQCMNCHVDRIDIVELAPHLIKSDKLAKIGLRFNKKLHYRFEMFNLEDQQFYNKLKNQPSLLKDDKTELELLEKIKDGNCSQCHLRIKKNDNSIDKQVNFISRNPISCAGCHEKIDPLTHPGKPLKRPTVETCQKCHHGKIHGKFKIFKADCNDLVNTDNCIKCHPNYQKN